MSAPIPVLLFTGFLGAGKTTLINRLIQAEHGRRILAMVNDFGAINIDAELIEREDAEEQVIGLANGCICCSLQGDFLRAVKTGLAREPRPEMIVVEASGVAEPGGIIGIIQDPTLWRAITLESVVCAVDAEDLAADPARSADPLWREQFAAADYVFLTKTAELPEEDLETLRARLTMLGPKPVFDVDAEPLPLDLLLAGPPADPEAGLTGGPRLRPQPAAAHRHDRRFATVEWTSEGPVDQAGFKSFLGRAAPQLLRAKGVVSFADMPGRSFLLQLVGRRATLTPHAETEPGCRLVFIGERAAMEPDALTSALDAIRA